MTNPFFTPKPPPPPAPQPDTQWIDPAEAAFNLTLPGGWKADGGLRRFEGGVRYAVFDITEPRGAVLFWGDPGLPLRYIVPAPWHAGLGLRMGERTWLGDATNLKSYIPSPYVKADLLAFRLMIARFGIVVPGRVSPDPEQVEAIRQKTWGANAPVSQIHAVIADFTSVDDTRIGQVHAATYGGSGLGETWDADFIFGYYGPADTIEATRAAFDKVRASFTAGTLWKYNNRDEPGKTAAATRAFLGKADFIDRQTAFEKGKVITATTKSGIEGRSRDIKDVL